MSSKKEPVSKPNTVGTNMPGALKGDRDKEGSISSKYQGRPRNALPNYPHNPSNSKPVSIWTQDHMQGQRGKNKQ